MFSGDVGTVWRAYALGTSRLHPAHLSRAAVDPLAVLFAWLTGNYSQESQQADFIDRQTGIGPGSVQTAGRTALFPAHASHEHHVTAVLRTLLQPAHASVRSMIFKYFTN